MNLYARYVGWLYFKYFVILFVALTLFYVGIDILTNLKSMPASANLKLLYFGLTSLTAVNYVLPLSLIFALIASEFSMIRSNELVSFYALGIDKNRLIKPPFYIALTITFVYVGLNFTPFAYAYEYGRNIVKLSNLSRTSSDIFLKFEGKFVYMDSLNPISGEAKDVRIFDINGSNLRSATFGLSARFVDDLWLVKQAKIVNLPQNIKLGEKGLDIKRLGELKTLENFKPKTIENAAAESSAITISDAVDYIQAFKNEGIGLNSVKTTLYNLAFSPFFAPFMVLIIYYFLPVTGRFFNLALKSFIFTIASLCVWGALFVMMRFARNGVISPEIGVLLPVILLGTYAFYLHFKAR
ncbi:permease, YjgP/YjgQ family [Campylobacter rectus RM3267]|uniref:Permease, YjgP/YjgQ family n=2 Tax=Campylobacter rectus TaxID=203 RepID=B9CYS0_CAMRE|nr:LptF/LptG family permease [Campylobacter rectus]EEF15052.1 permease, YjgP/YjgQ family [Campylobacter rectus RM3267]QCD47689.1 putative lipooligosaccharide transport system, permease component (LptG family) [Campylobacter rectus]UEB48386.1 LptF/LptG family permease [Campylobacter rectus]